MNPNCKKAINRISRIQGQLEAVKKKIESGADCASVVNLSLATAKSFDSLRAQIVRGYIEESLGSKSELSPETLDQLTKLIKS